MNTELLEQLRSFAVIPVVKIDDAKDAVDLARALREGGLNCAEITFRTSAAEQAIKNIHEAFPDMLIIAGTVLTPEQADKAIRAGAKGIVAPGLNPIMVQHCLDQGYPVMPGVCTPSEIEQGLSMGLTYLKFFPAEAAGGVKMLTAMAAPYTMVRFMPTGGINLNNVADYLNCKAVFCCGGSWMVPSAKIAAGEFEEIRSLAADAVKLVKELRQK